MLNIFVLPNQRPQWKSNPVKAAAARQDPADLFDDDEELNGIYQDDNIPNVVHDAGTTASEFDGAGDEAEEDEDNGVEAIEVDESESDEEPKSRKSTKKVRSQIDTLYRSHLKENYRPESVLQNATRHVCQK
jgi:hypothetical protein